VVLGARSEGMFVGKPMAAALENDVFVATQLNGAEVRMSQCQLMETVPRPWLASGKGLLLAVMEIST